MSTRNTILVVDDDTAHRTMLRTLVGGWGYEISEADDGDAAISSVRQRPYDLVLMDVRMLKVSGLEALAAIKSINPAIPVVIMTAYSSVETAVAALTQGAHDYLTKPLDFDKLRITLERAMEHSRLKAENRLLRERLGLQFDRRHIIGQSAAMVRLFDSVAQVAPSEATVLIAGESGTGKELIAGAIHFNSSRRDGPFVRLNCAAITETLLESELFGHEKGAFTGADRRREGRFFQADGGSLLLDEVSEMPLPMQVKLLRVLQEREFTRVGGDTVIRVDVRVIAATNKDLPELVSGGRFREDLYYRLNVVGLTLPALRERAEDIPLLALHFLEALALKNRKEVKGFTPQAMDRLILILGFSMIPLGALLGWSLIEQDTPVREAVATAVAGVITLVPEGLVLLVAVTYAVATLRMARRGALSRRLRRHPRQPVARLLLVRPGHHLAQGAEGMVVRRPRHRRRP